MNFELDDVQAQLQDSVRRLLAEKASFAHRRRSAAGPDGHDPLLWRHLADLGLGGLAIAQAQGGFGLGARGLLPVVQACGHALALTPLLSSAVLGATALQHAEDPAVRDRVLPSVASGEQLVAWAHADAPDGAAPAAAPVGARQVAGRWLLDGRQPRVLYSAAARWIVVGAATEDAAGGHDGPALFLVEADAPGLGCRAHRLVDDTPAAELRFGGVPALRLAGGDRARTAVSATRAMGMAAACADMLGAMERAFELAIEHLGTRQQFGRRIGDNQALRHKAAEMLVSLETARSMAIVAAIAADRPGAGESDADLLRAKLVVGRHARLVCQAAIQLHGGIGMTEEHPVGHALRRVHVLDHLFGDASAQARRLADLLETAT